MMVMVLGIFLRIVIILLRIKQVFLIYKLLTIDLWDVIKEIL